MEMADLHQMELFRTKFSPFARLGRAARPRLTSLHTPASAQLAYGLAPRPKQARQLCYTQRNAPHDTARKPSLPPSLASQNSHSKVEAEDSEKLNTYPQKQRTPLPLPTAPKRESVVFQLTSFVLCPQESQFVAMIMTSLKCGISGADSQGKLGERKASKQQPVPSSQPRSFPRYCRSSPASCEQHRERFAP